MASNIFKDIGDGLADFVKWVKESLEDEAIRKSIAEDLGLDPGQSIQQPPNIQLNNVDTYRNKANPDKEAFVALLNDVRALYLNVRTAVAGFGSSDVTRINSVVYLIFDMLALNYVRLYLPTTFAVIQAMSALVEDYSALDDRPYVMERIFGPIARAEEFLLSPIGYIFMSLVHGVENEERARQVSDNVFPHLAAFFLFAKKLAEHLPSSVAPAVARLDTREVIYGWDSLDIRGFSTNGDTPPRTPRADEISKRMLSVGFPFSQQTTSTPGSLSELFGMTLAIVPRQHSDKPGLQIGLSGTGEAEFQLTEKWKVVSQASATPAVSVLLKAEGGVPGFGVQPPTGIPLRVALVSVPDSSDVSFAVPDQNETRIEIGQFVFSVAIAAGNTALKAQALRCALVIAAKDHDGFLAKFLPAEGLRVPFSFGAGYEAERGFVTEGSIDWPIRPASLPGAASTPSALTAAKLPPASGLTSAAAPGSDSNGPASIPNLSGSRKPELGIQASIPIGKSLLGLTLDRMVLGLAPSQDSSKPQARIEASLSLSLKIGPVTAVIDRIGFEFGMSFPESGGNLGFADLSMGFKAPSGAGIKVDSPYVSGGGFLFLDRDKGQYAGFVQLTIQKRITVTGIGVLLARLPNGEKGYSFVVIITAQGFTPIPLGLGFTLTGIGGLLAINRTCNEEFLREGIKNKTLDDLLFPKDPVGNALRIFGTLNNAFPVQTGSYLFGPVLQISWRKIITMNLGVILELGNRTRLVILGKVSVILPNEANDLIRLQMNALGVVDFDKDSISLDAVLYDSRFAGRFPLTGSMAMRLNWGSAPQFALSIGGFHPAFKPPANFPALERLSISFSNSDSYRLRSESYFAITSNTLQFGSKMEMYVRAGGFSIEGGFGWDVLVQFSPFGFIADFLAFAQIKRGSHSLFKLKLEGELTGPRPLRIKGKVTFEFLWFDVTIRVDKTLISGDRPPALVPAAVMPELVAALRDPRNWTGQLAENDRRMVTLRDSSTPDQIAMHPIGRLSVKQTVVPLDVPISRFGNTTPADGQLFKLNGIRVNGNNVAFDRIKDFFAPSQFLDLTDDQKLQAPSFEPMAAGASIGADSFLFTSNGDDILEDEVLAFETIIVDQESNASRRVKVAPITPEVLSRQILLGAAARSDLRQAGAERYRPAASKNTVSGKRWSIVSTLNGSTQPVAAQVASYSESFQTLQNIKKQNPNSAKSLMLVRLNAE